MPSNISAAHLCALVTDNLKAIVQHADWYDPEVHPKLETFAAHCGTVFLAQARSSPTALRCGGTMPSWVDQQFGRLIAMSIL